MVSSLVQAPLWSARFRDLLPALVFLAERAVFAGIQQRLIHQAGAAGEQALRLTVPMLYLGAEK